MNKCKNALIWLLLGLVFSGVANAQTFSGWLGVQGAYPVARASVVVGVGLDLPIGLGTLGLELAPYGISSDGQIVFGVAAVLRDVPVPFTPISLRAALGLEKQTVSGNPFDTQSWAVFLGGGARYIVFGPLGVFGDVRVYLGAAQTFSVVLGADLKF